jgi:PAS domain-containing protein
MTAVRPLTLRDCGREATEVPTTQLTSGKQAPREAREFVASILSDSHSELRARACQVVTELVTNSVRHARGSSITVDAHVGARGCVDIDVRDDGDGFDVQPRAAGHADPSGWGLMFVDLLSDGWGCGGLGSPIVSTHFEPRSLEEDPLLFDPMVEERVSDLLDVRLLLDSVKDYAIFALDKSGTITLWNAGGERLTGFSAEEMLGRPVGVLHGERSPAGASSTSAGSTARTDRASGATRSSRRSSIRTAWCAASPWSCAT